MQGVRYQYERMVCMMCTIVMSSEAAMQDTSSHTAKTAYKQMNVISGEAITDRKSMVVMMTL